MDINNLLKEYNETSPVLTYRDLNSMQVSCLVRIMDETLSYETASPREMATIDSLIDLGLVDDAYQLTSAGLRAAQLGKKYGSKDRRRASVTDTKLNRTGGQATRYTDVDDNAGYESETDDDFLR